MTNGASYRTRRAWASSRTLVARLASNRELRWTAGAQVLLVAQGVAQVKILTTFLSKADYGHWSLLLSASLLLGMLPFSAFDQGVARLRGEQKTDGASNSLLIQVAAIYVAIFAVWTLILLVVSWANGVSTWTVTLPLLAFALTEILRNATISYRNAARERRAVALHRGWDASAKTVAMLVLAYCGLLEPVAVLCVLSLVNMLGLALFSTGLAGASLAEIKSIEGRVKYVWSFSWPLAIWALFGWFQPMISRWYLTEWANPETVASFAVIISVAMFAPNFAYTVLAAYLLPVLYQKPGPLPQKKYLIMTAAFGAALAVYTLMTVQWAGLLLTVLTDDKYVELARYIPWVTASTSLNFMAALYASELFRAGATRKLLAPTVAPGLLSLTVGAILVHEYGLDGAVATFVSGQLVYASAAAYVTTQHFRERRVSAT